MLPRTEFGLVDTALKPAAKEERIGVAECGVGVVIAVLGRKVGVYGVVCVEERTVIEDSRLTVGTAAHRLCTVMSLEWTLSKGREESSGDCNARTFRRGLDVVGKHGFSFCITGSTALQKLRFASHVKSPP